MFLSVYLNKNTHPADSDKLSHTHTGTENLTRRVLLSPSLISVESFLSHDHLRSHVSSSITEVSMKDPEVEIPFKTFIDNFTTDL